jgi:hypothetical protein
MKKEHIDKLERVKKIIKGRMELIAKSNIPEMTVNEQYEFWNIYVILNEIAEALTNE